SEACGMMPLHKAREAADATRLPLMVHPQAAWCDSLDDILAVMGRGDVLTHLYHPMECGIFDDQGNVRTSVRDAAERGVMFDVGHGQGSFDWAMADSGLAQRLLPHVISSDLHFHNVHGPVYDLVGVASKFLHLGLSLDDVIARVTRAPADVLGMGDRIGTLAPGAFGDAVVLEERAGAFSMEDAFGTVRTVERRLEPIVVVKGGRIYRDHC
ncbi:MAG: amidohydrolase/deacetylase family metallohydrolase, partial [Phycisphaeraceae bacterium]|nr:amidohydrolase/deacetylase family metallohydrolase [Phycisphaeraceae bacterium]